MKELKIDPELRDLLPRLSKEKFEGLEKMILEEGYDGTPILIWNGYIVDGHHRYKIFNKHNIEFNIEEISLPKESEKSDVMDWMITYQDVRRNMCEAEKIYANDKVSARRIEEENEKKRLEGNRKGADITNGHSVSVQMDAERKQQRDRSTNTREQRAKIAGVSAGTVAYDTKEEVMRWMLDIQLGRRNLSPIQRIAVTEKYRPIYEKKAKENQGARNDLKNNIPQNLGESEKKKAAKDREVNSKLAKVANVNPETYRQAKRVLDSNNDDLKQRVLSGKTSINAGYKELTQDYICRRGEVGGSAKKVGLRIKELERLYEIEHGGSRRNNCVLKTHELLG